MPPTVVKRYGRMLEGQTKRKMVRKEGRDPDKVERRKNTSRVRTAGGGAARQVQGSEKQAPGVRKRGSGVRKTLIGGNQKRCPL